MRFIIENGLPYLLSNGKTRAVRWDKEGFHIGAEVKLTSAHDVTYPELSVKAKCAVLDSFPKKTGRKKATEK